MMWALTIAVLIIVAGAIHAQKKHHEFLDHQKLLKESLHTDQHVKEFQEYKKRVDVLTLKAGFKL